MTTAPCLALLFAALPPQDPPAPLAAATAAGRHAPTFTQDVAPIVLGHCAMCHRPGEVAPFSLLSFADVQKRGKMIRQVVDDRFMPPWHPEPGYGEFRNCLRLPDADVHTIDAWVDGGMVEGPKDALPPLPKFPTGWQLGEPDLVLQMEKGFEVPASGRDIYRNFVVQPNQDQDRWLTAIEVRPSARAVLHHIVFFLDETGESRKIDGHDGRPGWSGMRLQRGQMIDSWAVGGMPQRLPDGLAIKLPKGADLVLQSHFHMSGKKETEQVTLGLYFSKQPPEHTLVPIQLPPFFGITAGIDIPAGDDKWRLHDSFTLPCDVDARVVGGHGHMLLRTLHLDAELPGGKKEPLLFIPDWDFDWQNRYVYQRAVHLPKGAVISSELLYDNSDKNPNNPNKPPKRVHWGQQTTDEMGSITVLVTPADEKDLQTLTDAVRKKMVDKAMSRVEDEIDARFAELDKNHDGKITIDEVPPRQRRFFDLLDRNHDGVLDKEEIKAMIGAGAGSLGGLPDGGGSGGQGSGGSGNGGNGGESGGGSGGGSGSGSGNGSGNGGTGRGRRGGGE
jgi:hypothetical protein